MPASLLTSLLSGLDASGASEPELPAPFRFRIHHPSRQAAQQLPHSQINDNNYRISPTTNTLHNVTQPPSPKINNSTPTSTSTLTSFDELPDNNFRAPPPNPNLASKNPLWAEPDSVEKPDWGCVGKSSGGPNFPGVRYGSAAIKPLVIVKPCACPGGVITPPLATPYGFRDSDGLWHPPKKAKTALLVGYPDWGSKEGSSLGKGSKSGTKNTKNQSAGNHSEIAIHNDGGSTSNPTSFFSGISNWLGSLVNGVSETPSLNSTPSFSHSFPPSSAAFSVTNTNTHWIRPKLGQTERIMLNSSSFQGDESGSGYSRSSSSSTGHLGFDRSVSTSFAKYGKNPGWEPYNPDYGCVDSPHPFTGRGKKPGLRQGRFWVANVTATPCNCDNEAEMMLNNVKKPSVDVVLNPTTLQTFRQILRLDYPDEEEIPAGYMQVDSFLRSKAAQGELKPYYEYRGEEDGGGYGGSGDYSSGSGDYSFGGEDDNGGSDDFQNNLNSDNSGIGGPDFLSNFNSNFNSRGGRGFGSRRQNNMNNSLKSGRWVFHGYAEAGEIPEDGAYDQIQMLKWNNF